MKKTILILFTLSAAFLQAQVRVVSYNVENLFNTTHDTLKLDEDFTPAGKYHWTPARYQRKIDNLSRVLVNIGEWTPPVVVGLCEVENEQCLQDMVVYGPLKNLGYSYIHRESPDQRGIDCALLYQPKQFRLLRSDFLPVPMPQGERPTRDIVYAVGVVGKRDTLHIMMCHLPSQLGGTEATAHKRAAAHRVLQAAVDSILAFSPQAKIIIMGDMNAKPTDQLQGMHNLMMPLEQQQRGTHKWKGEWSCLDQFYVSEALLPSVEAHIYDAEFLQHEDEHFGGLEPFRCYYGLQWQNGYSDHLPIYLDIK